MCESGYKTAGERHGMCESGYKTAGERHGMCESAIKSAYFATSQQTARTCTGHAASILYATGNKLLLRHLQTTKEIPHVVVISLSVAYIYICVCVCVYTYQRPNP
jgi:hypothetical protein